MSFDMAARFRSGLPPAEPRWTEAPRFSFVGGHGDAAAVPFTGLAEAAVEALRRDGPALAAYNLGGDPLGYRPLRTFIAESLGVRAQMRCEPDDVLVTSGSLQALDLVNGIFLEPGDTVVVDEATYGGMLSRLARSGVTPVGAPLDRDGIRTDRLADLLATLDRQGRRPKYLYTIPTVQNPTGAVATTERRLELLALARRHGVPIFEDDCYADLLWEGERPPTIRALDDGGGQVVYCGSFSKTIAPALRVGYVVADWPVLAQMLALKTDAGSGALEQMVLATYAASHFDSHVSRLVATLRSKGEAMAGAIEGSFGDVASFERPRGGIFVWLALPEGVDTAALVAPAAAAGVEFNPGAGWSADPAWGARRMRLCFGHPSEEEIVEGVAVLADVVARETGLRCP